MKKIIFVLLCICLIGLTGCDHVGEIENNRVITACIVEKTNKDLTYGFYVSVPTGGEGGEDTGSKSSAKVYEFKAKNFSEALELFEKSGVNKTDVTHISLFAGNEKYFNEKFYDDEKHIRKHITATPLIYACIYQGKSSDVVECINKEYSSKAEDFAENIFSTKSSELSCMLSELSLSSNNSLYTSAIPIIKISKKGKNKLPEITNIAVYSALDGITVLHKDEYTIYSKWRKKYKIQSDGYDISIKNNKLIVVINNKSVCNIAKEYAKNNIDILNVKYFSKKCFITYQKYKSFIKNYDFSKTIFSGD